MKQINSNKPVTTINISEILKNMTLKYTHSKIDRRIVNLKNVPLY